MCQVNEKGVNPSKRYIMFGSCGNSYFFNQLFPKMSFVKGSLNFAIKEVDTITNNHSYI
jgi:hypothetical protein